MYAKARLSEQADVSQEIELARSRMTIVGRVPEGKPYSVKVIAGYLVSWKTLLFTLIFGGLNLTSYFAHEASR